MRKKVLCQLAKHNMSLVAVHKLGKIFLLFAPNAIYVYGDPKEIKKFQKHHNTLLK